MTSYNTMLSTIIVHIFALLFVVNGVLITQPAHKINSSSATLSYYKDTRPYNSHNIHAFYSWTANPIGHFQVLYPPAPNNSSACMGYLKPSQRAKQHGCLYATNGGPFVMNQPAGKATCLGMIISMGKEVQLDSTNNANFGLTTDGNFVMGQLTPDQAASMKFEQLVSGFGMLLVNGTIYPQPGGEIAPRTAIGTDKLGRLIIFEADGIEKNVFGSPVGLTLYQTAQWAASLGVYNMVNLDGGGSSTTFYNGTIVNFPTCRDVNVFCEREVTTMTCIMP